MRALAWCPCGRNRRQELSLRTFSTSPPVPLWNSHAGFAMHTTSIGACELFLLIQVKPAACVPQSAPARAASRNKLQLRCEVPTHLESVELPASAGYASTHPCAATEMPAVKT